MARETMAEKKAKLNALIQKARGHYHATVRMVGTEVNRKEPNLEWWQKQAKVEEDPRVRIANERLLALCDAANIMGVEID